MAFSEKNLKSLLNLALEHNATDIHIREKETPCFRIQGELVNIQTKDFEKDDIKDLYQIFTQCKYENNLTEIDGSYESSDLCRIRYNFFLFAQKIGIAIRIINLKIPTFKDLNLPSKMSQITEKKKGITLITGPTGSGKSSTLASMINYLNSNYSKHIVTIEDPIEYLHPSIKSRISQREIGIDTKNYVTGLKSALRQDPDIIMIGEMRDTETIDTALKAAETGHHVLATLHTSNALSTIHRIASMFGPHELESINARLAESLNAILAQRMVPDLTGKKMIPVQEILVNGPGIQECIVGKEDTSRIIKIIQDGEIGTDSLSQSFDHALIRLYEKGKISRETAINFSDNPDNFDKKILME